MVRHSQRLDIHTDHACLPSGHSKGGIDLHHLTANGSTANLVRWERWREGQEEERSSE